MPPTPVSLEKRSTKYCRIDHFLIVLLLAGNVALCTFIALRGDWYVFLVSLILFILSYLIHLAWSNSLFFRSKTKLAAFGISQKIGRYRASEIYLMVQELLAPHRGKEIPRVFVTDEKYDGAFVVNSLLFNFVRPLNAVYISSHLFKILKPGEVKAIIAHELAHFYRYIRPLNRVRFALMGVNATFPIYVVHDGTSISVLAALGVWFAFSFLFNSAINIWLMRTSRDHEYLCDLSAARRYGVLNIINGLFGVVRTGEIQGKIYRALLDRIQSDKSLSIDSLAVLVRQCEEMLPAKPVSDRKLSRILKAVLKSEETKGIRRPLSLRAQKKEKTQIVEMANNMMLNHEFKLIEWKRFDNVIPDGRLNRSEYKRLIRIFETNPNAQLFDSPFDNVDLVSKSSHPTVKERIQFLEYARQLDPSLSLEETRETVLD